MRVAIIWQRFLPYHVARLGAVARGLRARGHELVAVEIASKDATYDFPPFGGDDGFERRVCFGGLTYHSLSATSVWETVLGALREVQPEVIFAPATPFPEGMAAIHHRLESNARVVMMDDAWEASDVRGPLTSWTKRLIHKNVDAAFTPAPSHAAYFRGLGFPEDRIVFGVDAVDNDCFAREAARIRVGRNVEAETAPHFLFVGRIIQRKGLDSLLQAYAVYRRMCRAEPWGLVVVGGGPDADRLEGGATPEGVTLVGQRFGAALCESYARAGALVVPSLRDPWGLVANEAMASALPVLVSRGCGCAQTLVREGENGWTFEPGDSGALSALMGRLAELPVESRRQMGRRSQEIVAAWGLPRFVAGVEQALAIPRRAPAGALSNLLVRAWKGHVRVEEHGLKRGARPEAISRDQGPHPATDGSRATRIVT